MRIVLDYVTEDPIKLTPDLSEKDALFWVDRLRELQPDCAVYIVVDDEPSENWLIENLPQTKPPTNPRPGAEYGVNI